MTPKYATIATWTALSGVGRTTTYALLKSGALRAARVGDRWLIDVEHGMAWIASQVPPEDPTRNPMWCDGYKRGLSMASDLCAGAARRAPDAISAASLDAMSETLSGLWAA